MPLERALDVFDAHMQSYLARCLLNVSTSIRASRRRTLHCQAASQRNAITSWMALSPLVNVSLVTLNRLPLPIK